MQKLLLSLLSLLTWMGAEAQTARHFVLSNSSDNLSELHCFLPAQPSGRAIVACPGGAYGGLAFDKEGTDWAEWFNGQGIAYFTLKYRMPNGNPEIPVGDAYHAMRLVRDSAAVWGINPYDVGIMGFSAGGHLAATVSTKAPFDARPDFSILVYPVITMSERWSHAGSVRRFLGDKKSDDATVKYWSAEGHVTHYATPPTILLLSNDDLTVPPVTNGIAYYSALRKTGIPCAMHVYPTGQHGYGFSKEFQYHDLMLTDLQRWLTRLPAPKKEALRVACIGNSITRGACIDMAGIYGYPAQLQRLLGDGYQVRNFGMSGYTLLNKGNNPYMKTECWQMAKDFQPDIVIIKLGTNDSKPYNWQYAKEFPQDMQQMINELKALSSKPRIVLCTPIPAFRDNLNIVEANIRDGVIPAIRKVAKKNKLELIDLHTLFTDRQLMSPDDIHPNADGAALMAKIIAETIKK
jgi:acetyl esterase/lipase